MGKMPAWFWEYSSMSQIHGFTFVCASRGQPLGLTFWLVVIGIFFTAVASVVFLLRSRRRPA